MVDSEKQGRFCVAQVIVQDECRRVEVAGVLVLRSGRYLTLICDDPPPIGVKAGVSIREALIGGFCFQGVVCAKFALQVSSGCIRGFRLRTKQVVGVDGLMEQLGAVRAATIAM